MAAQQPVQRLAITGLGSCDETGVVASIAIVMNKFNLLITCAWS